MKSRNLSVLAVLTCLMLLAASSALSQTPISCGQVLNSNIAVATKTDIYQYTSDGQPVEFSHTGCAGSYWSPQADFYNSGGQVVFSTSLCAGATNLTLAAGTYMIWVHDSNYNDTGSYVFGMQSPLGSCGSTPISCGQVIASNITTAAKSHVYQYVSDGQLVEFSHTGCAGSYWSPRADFYNSGGQVVFSTSLCAGATNLSLAAGAYTILVHDSNYNDTGSYVFGMQSPLGSCGSTPISCGQVIASNITTAAKSHVYQYVSDGQLVEFSHTGCAGSYWSPQADFYNSGGQVVFSTSLCGGAINLTLAAGAYTILVHDSNYNDTGGYVLGMQSPLGSCGSTPISCGQVIASNLTTAAKSHVYQYTSCGQLVQFSHTGCAGSYWSPQADFYNSGGQVVFSTSLCAGATNLSLAAGAYTILVHDSNYNDTGGYSLSATCFGDCGLAIITGSSPIAGGLTSGGGTYTNGATVTVTATANSCYQFVNWTEGGTVVSSSASYTFTASASRTLVANFSQTNYTISLSSSPSAGGSVSGGGTRACGSSETVTATPNPCYQFVNWTEGGTVVSSSASYTFTASASRTLVASFSQISYSISTSASPAGGGTTGGGGSKVCSTSVTVCATPATCYQFVNWTESETVVSASACYTFTAATNRTLVAHFSQIMYTIGTSASPSNGGTTSGGGSRACGSSVTVVAAPHAGYSFVNWTEGGTGVSASASYTFTASGDRTLVASFTNTAPLSFTIATSASPANGGSTGGDGSYPAGGTATVMAIANNGFSFASWKEGGATVSTLASYTFTVNASRNLVANFAAFVTQPPVITGLTVSNALLIADGVVVTLVDEPLYFAVQAYDPGDQPLSYGWTFCDGASVSNQDAVHVFTNCGPCSVGVAVTDGSAVTSSNVPVAAVCAMSVTSFQGKLNFAKPNSDSCKLRAAIEAAACSALAGKQVTVLIGGAQVSFTLDDKGRGVGAYGSCRVSSKSGTVPCTLDVKLKGGDWQNAWAAYGLVNATIVKPGFPVTLPVTVVIGDEAFMAENPLHYTAKSGKSGTAK